MPDLDDDDMPAMQSYLRLVPPLDDTPTPDEPPPECDPYAGYTEHAGEPNASPVVSDTQASERTSASTRAGRKAGPRALPARTLDQDAADLDAEGGQILGVGDFDQEVEAWLTSRGLSVRRNNFEGRLEMHAPGDVKPMNDALLAKIRFKLKHASNGKMPAKEDVADALAIIGERNSYNPVTDYLAGLKWDGVSRIDKWLIEFAGAEDTTLHRAFGRKMLCAAVRRAKAPGSKFDHILVLQGAQDLGKSLLIRTLCPDPKWCSDQVTVGADAQETIERTAGAWIVELAELDGLGKRDANRVKSFITTIADRSRLAYGRYVVERPRAFVLFGSTNESAFLNDLSGNRRWWPVRVTGCDIDGLTSVRDQLWAEAVQAEPMENLWLDDAGLKASAAAATDAVLDHGPWFEILAGEIPEEGAIKISVADAWRLVGIQAKDVNRISVQHRLNMRKAMAALGFDPETKTHRRNGCKTRLYVRGNQDTAQWWEPEDPEPPQLQVW